MVHNKLFKINRKIDGYQHFLDQRKASLPYHPNLSECIARVFNRIGVRIIHQTQAKLRDIIVKKRCDRPLDVVHTIACKDRDWSYVGESGRTLNERVNDHRRAVRNYNSSSEIANHYSQTSHTMN